jgi:hypothetical protein
MPRSPWTIALALILCLTAACGAVGTAEQPSPLPSASQSSSPSGSPSGTARVFTFKLNPADSTVTAKGTITVTAGPKTTTIELKITGLSASSSHITHVHLGSCAGRGGIAYALNQVVADGQGVSDTKTTFNATYPPTGPKWYVVVHAGPNMQGDNSKYLLCGNVF